MNINMIYIFFAKIFRTRRMKQFVSLFVPNDSTCILDVGGTPYNWSLISQKPKLVLLKLSAPVRRDENHTWIAADGCHLPFASQSFDIVYSNSVIEHVSNWQNQNKFAREVRRVG